MPVRFVQAFRRLNPRGDILTVSLPHLLATCLLLTVVLESTSYPFCLFGQGMKPMRRDGLSSQVLIVVPLISESESDGERVKGRVRVRERGVRVIVRERGERVRQRVREMVRVRERESV